MKILVVDVGGTHVKFRTNANDEVRKIPSGPEMTAQQMVEDVRQATAEWEYDVVTIGFPGPVVNGQPFQEPHNLAAGWVNGSVPNNGLLLRYVTENTRSNLFTFDSSRASSNKPYLSITYDPTRVGTPSFDTFSDFPINATTDARANVANASGEGLASRAARSIGMSSVPGISSRCVRIRHHQSGS